jgi:amino acid transporter
MKKIFSFLLVFVLGFSLLGGSVLAETGIDIKQPKGFADNLGTVISSAINLIFMVAALIAFGFLIFGGIEWITSGGDKGKTEGARNKITAAVVGLLILAASWAIIDFTLGLLGFDGGIEDVMKETPNFTEEKTEEKTKDVTKEKD